MTDTIQIPDIVDIQLRGNQALVDELGMVGAIRYWEINDGGGYGDYTKEKYNAPPTTIDEIVSDLVIE